MGATSRIQVSEQEILGLLRGSDDVDRTAAARDSVRRNDRPSMGVNVGEIEGHRVPSPIVERLRCPRCGERMDADGDGVRCVNDHRYPRRRGVLDFSGAAEGGSTQRTFASFGYEWNAFDGIRDEDEDFSEIYFRDLDLPSLKGKIGLDAGCGKGRYTRFLARHLDAEVALDGSSAVDAAARTLVDLDNVVVVQSDLRHAPFAPASFDFISSLGVLHHLDDPFAGFTSLLTYLAPRGQILLYLYSRPERADIRSAALGAAKWIRTVSVRIPHRVLKPIATPVAGLLYAGVVLPGQWGKDHGVARRGTADGHVQGQALPEPRAGHLRPAERSGRAPLCLE